MSAKLTPCATCEKMISPNAVTCPHCGEPEPHKIVIAEPTTQIIEPVSVEDVSEVGEPTVTQTEPELFTPGKLFKKLFLWVGGIALFGGLAWYAMTQTGGDLHVLLTMGGGVLGMTASVLLVCGLFAVYLLPSIIGITRNHHNAGGIIAVNLLLGWTFIGWALALIWAATAVNPSLQTQ